MAKEGGEIFMRIGIQELLVIFIVALIVLGPDKLPVYAQKLGEALKEFRKISADATKDIRESIVEPLDKAKRPLQEALEPVTQLENDVRDNVKELQKSFSDIGKAPVIPHEQATESDKTPDAEANIPLPIINSETSQQENKEDT